MLQSINDVDFNLTDEEVNKKYALLFMREHKLKEFNTNHVLYSVGNKLILIDVINKHILYYVQWKEKFYKFINHIAVSQVAVWRDKDTPGYEDLPRKIFFDYLLKKHRVITTDTKQTDDGRRFWVGRVGNALNAGLNVYYANLMQDEKGINRELIKINSVDDFVELNKAKKFWGKSDKFQAKRIIISEIDLV